MVSLGNETRSTTSTRSPCRASSIAVAAPATRAPTTITSYRPAPIAASTHPSFHTLPYGSSIRYRTVMAEQKASGQRRLTRDDWITAALGAIADGGLAAVGVEPLAARLGATKGSFYWHFENRDALLEAAIRRWEKETTTDVTAEITAAHDAPASQFRRLVVGVIERAEQDRVGPALLASATHPTVAPALARGTGARLNRIAALYRARV